MKRPATDAATKARALQRAEEVGAAQASRELGIPSATIRAWRARRAPVDRTPAPGEDLDAFELRVLERAKNAVELALKRMEELLPTARGVQSVAISSGILLDKVAALHAVIQEAQEREVRITERDAGMLLQSLEHYFEALEFPFSGAARKTWAMLLRQLMNGEALGVPPEALEARAELQAAMRSKWGPALRAEIRAEVEHEVEARLPRMLPRAPDPPMPEPEPEPPEPEPDDGVEVVTGEVVVEPIVEPGGWTVDPVSGRRTRPFRPGGRPPAGRQFGRGAW